jgi:hypothetical protein
MPLSSFMGVAIGVATRSRWAADPQYADKIARVANEVAGPPDQHGHLTYSSLSATVHVTRRNRPTEGTPASSMTKRR